MTRAFFHYLNATLLYFVYYKKDTKKRKCFYHSLRMVMFGNCFDKTFQSGTFTSFKTYGLSLQILLPHRGAMLYSVLIATDFRGFKSFHSYDKTYFGTCCNFLKTHISYHWILLLYFIIESDLVPSFKFCCSGHRQFMSFHFSGQNGIHFVNEIKRNPKEITAAWGDWGLLTAKLDSKTDNCYR